MLKNIMTAEQYSYLYGFLLSDGYIKIDNKRISGFKIELSIKDKDIIEKLHNIIPNSTISERTRNTNFKENYHSVSLVYNRQDLPNDLILMGFPIQNKSDVACPPISEYSRRDFWRGVIDGDGSIGYRKNNDTPFISLVTKSEPLKIEYCKYVNEITGKNFNINRNKRDNVYNIDISGKKAQLFGKELYENSDLYLQRKYESYLHILEKEYDPNANLKAAKERNKNFRKKVVCVTTNEVFVCSKHAAEYFNIWRDGINKCANGHQHTSGKLHTGEKLIWEYFDPEKHIEDKYTFIEWNE